LLRLAGLLGGIPIGVPRCVAENIVFEANGETG
jgi:hypothetical protein